MRPNKKLVLAVVVLSTGIGGALLFRKPRATTETDAVHGPEVRMHTGTEAPAWQPTTPIAPHLLGRIDKLDPSQLGPASDQTPPPAPTAASQFPASATSNPDEMPESPPWSDGDDETAAASADGDLNPPSTNRLATTRRTRQPRTHRVADGDTLTKLAQHYLGRADRFQEIFQANQNILKTPDVLPIGAILTIPDAHASADETNATPPAMVEIPLDQLRAARTQMQPVSAPLSAGRSYTVQPHDTLTAIARHHYGDATRYTEILQANAKLLRRPEDLRQGMVLIIP